MNRGARKVVGAIAVLVAFAAAFGARPANAGTLEQEHQCLALAIYWEARGEGTEGMIAVGWTVLNRVNSPRFPATVCGVVKQGGETPPCQFSWWCDGRSDRPRERTSWNTAAVLASRLLLDPPPDPTDGALFYHNTSVRPSWMHAMSQTAAIGAHIFYR